MTALIVPAAGALVWRIRDGLEVALVHRPRYDDWSWPKGKLDPGETFAEAAAREVLEETGLVVRLGIPLPELVYSLVGGHTKVVKYWAAQVAGGSGALEHEIDEVRWLSVEQARLTLTYERDQIPLDALVKAHDAGELDTWPLLLVRHAHAQSRASYDGTDDALRPLSSKGQERSRSLIPLLQAWAPLRITTSKAVRCVDTVTPYAKKAGLSLHEKRSLTEEVFADDPQRAVHIMERVFDRAKPAVVCVHRPLIPTLISMIGVRTVFGSNERRITERISDDGMDKGEVLVAQVVGGGVGARVISLERMRTPLSER